MDIDLIEPEQWTRGIPHDQLAWLRAEAPVYWHETDHPAMSRVLGPHPPRRRAGGQP